MRGLAELLTSALSSGVLLGNGGVGLHLCGMQALQCTHDTQFGVYYVAWVWAA